MNVCSISTIGFHMVGSVGIDIRVGPCLLELVTYFNYSTQVQHIPQTPTFITLTHTIAPYRSLTEEHRVTDSGSTSQ